MGPISTLNHLSFLLLPIYLLTFPGAATADHDTDQDGNTGMSSGIPLTNPKDNGDKNGSGATTSSADSIGLIGDQPMTVQLGAGFIVGCVTGVVLYATVRLCYKVSQRSLADTRQRAEVNRNQGEMVPALVDV